MYTHLVVNWIRAWIASLSIQFFFILLLTFYLPLTAYTHIHTRRHTRFNLAASGTSLLVIVCELFGVKLMVLGWECLCLCVCVGKCISNSFTIFFALSLPHPALGIHSSHKFPFFYFLVADFQWTKPNSSYLLLSNRPRKQLEGVI